MFHLFTETPYTFLEIGQLVEGNVITSETPASGVFKDRSSMTQTDNIEKYIGDATLHIKPSESFVNDLVGNGVRVNGTEYRITDVVEGKDFDNGQVEFYRAILKIESFAWQDQEVLS